MTTAANPLVAQRVAPTVDPFAGIWICEDIQTIARASATAAGSTAASASSSAGLDALAFVSDPVGALLQYGIAWLIEHVKPLSEALDWLAGDPAQISAHAQTWRNVAAPPRGSRPRTSPPPRSRPGRVAAAARPTPTAPGPASRQTAIEGLARGADTMAAITEGAAGMLIAAVRLMVRDAIATSCPA